MGESHCPLVKAINEEYRLKNNANNIKQKMQQYQHIISFMLHIQRNTCTKTKKVCEIKFNMRTSEECLICNILSGAPTKGKCAWKTI